MIIVFMIMSKLKSVRKLYNGLYRTGYPHGGLGFPITWSGINTGELTCLDIGCGHGILGRRFKKYVGIDISDYVIDENKKRYPELEFYALDAKNISSKLGEFDIVIAIDTFEHFPQSEIEEHLKAISGIKAGFFLFSICCRESGFAKGLHTCLMSREKWLLMIGDYFKIVDSSELNRQSTFCVKAENL